MRFNLWHLGFGNTLFSLTKDFRQLKSVGYAGKLSQPWETYSHALISASTLWNSGRNLYHPFLKERRRNVTLFSSYIGICCSGRCLESDNFIDCGGRGCMILMYINIMSPQKDKSYLISFDLGVFLSWLICGCKILLNNESSLCWIVKE